MIRTKEIPHQHNKHSIFTWPSVFLSALGGVACVVFLGLFEYQVRLNLTSLMLALCAGCYMNGPYGRLESAGGLFFYLCAYFGLHNPAWLGLGWLIHGIVDAFHHHADYPIVHWMWFSSVGCAAMDPILAAYFFMGAPTIF
jgi:hypothetical protein